MAQIVFEESEEQLAAGSGPKFLSRGIYLWPVVAVTGKIFDKGNFGLSIVFDSGYVKEGQPVFEEKTYWLLDKNSGFVDPNNPALGYKEINITQLNKLRADLIKVFDVPFSKVSSIVDTVETNKLKGLVMNLAGTGKADAVYALVGKKATITYDWPNQTNHPEGKYFTEIQFLNDANSFDYWAKRWETDPRGASRANPNPAKPAAAGTTTVAPVAAAPVAAAPVAPFAQGLTLIQVPGAMYTIEQCRAGGWSEEQMIQQGIATRPTPPPVAPPVAPPATSAAAAYAAQTAAQPTAAEMAAARQVTLPPAAPAAPANIGDEPDDLPF